MRAFPEHWSIKLKRKGKTLYAIRTQDAITNKNAYNIYQPMKHNPNEWEYLYTEGQKFVDDFKVEN